MENRPLLHSGRARTDSGATGDTHNGADYDKLDDDERALTARQLRLLTAALAVTALVVLGLAVFVGVTYAQTQDALRRNQQQTADAIGSLVAASDITCTITCRNGGAPTADCLACSCSADWTGAACETPAACADVCAHSPGLCACGGRGQLNVATCACDCWAGNSGDACETFDNATSTESVAAHTAAMLGKLAAPAAVRQQRKRTAGADVVAAVLGRGVDATKQLLDSKAFCADADIEAAPCSAELRTYPTGKIWERLEVVRCETQAECDRALLDTPLHGQLTAFRLPAPTKIFHRRDVADGAEDEQQPGVTGTLTAEMGTAAANPADAPTAERRRTYVPVIEASVPWWSSAIVLRAVPDLVDLVSFLAMFTYESYREAYQLVLQALGVGVINRVIAGGVFDEVTLRDSRGVILERWTTCVPSFEQCDREQLRAFVAYAAGNPVPILYDSVPTVDVTRALNRAVAIEIERAVDGEVSGEIQPLKDELEACPVCASGRGTCSGPGTGGQCVCANAELLGATCARCANGAYDAACTAPKVFSAKKTGCAQQTLTLADVTFSQDECTLSGIHEDGITGSPSLSLVSQSCQLTTSGGAWLLQAQGQRGVFGNCGLVTCTVTCRRR